MKKMMAGFLIVLLPILSLYNCSTKTIKYDSSIDYCSKMESLKKFKYITNSEIEDSSRAYGIAMLNCLYQNIVEHNKDSLTTDNCLCLKRLEKALKSDFDSVTLIIDSVPGTHEKQLTIFPKDPNILDGIQEYLINDSCKILGFDNIIKR